MEAKKGIAGAVAVSLVGANVGMWRSVDQWGQVLFLVSACRLTMRLTVA